MTSRIAYYYAGGERIDLEPANQMAVPAGVSASSDAVRAISQGRTLPHGLVLVDFDQADPVVQHDLTAAAGAQPVFRYGDSLLVSLPEVRVEESRDQHQAALRKWLRQHGQELEVEEHEGGRITIRPSSHSGWDAMQLAAQLHEQLHLEMAQPRFVRVTPHPNGGNVARRQR